MRKRGFLSSEERQAPIDLSRVGLAQHRVARRADALVLVVDSADAASTMALLAAIERQFRDQRRIHTFVDNAR